MISRRVFAAGVTLAAGAALTRASNAQVRALGEPVRFSDPATRDPLPRKRLGGRTGFVTLNGGSLPWRMKGGVKEFHLVAEPVEREFAPGIDACNCWGYNGTTPGPDHRGGRGRSRAHLSSPTGCPSRRRIHWHGILLPNGMDGVGGLTQPQIRPGETYVYEFTLTQHGTLHVPPARRRDGADGAWA